MTGHTGIALYCVYNLPFAKNQTMRRPELTFWWSPSLAYSKPSLQANEALDFRNVASMLHVAMSAASFHA